MNGPIISGEVGPSMKGMNACPKRPRKLSDVTTSSEFLICGRMMLNRMRNGLAPTSSAASIAEVGMADIPAVRTSRVNGIASHSMPITGPQGVR